MKKLEYEIKFNTPAFIGDANQSSAWRTPPFKALMRSWWRFVWAAQNNCKVDDLENLRSCESKLFGDTSQQSKIRMRLSPKRRSACREVDRGNYDYLRYGREESNAIETNTESTLSLLIPEKYESEIISVMSLIHDYGTIGGRCRNGWGSIHLTSEHVVKSSGDMDITSNWKEAIERGWPHAIGTDENGPLIWRTKICDSSWKKVMDKLTHLRREINRKASARDSERRSYLSYPVKGRSNLDSIIDRSPNALRFKVKSEAGHLYGIVFYVPAINKKAYESHRSTVLETWETTFKYLDMDMELLRIGN